MTISIGRRLTIHKPNDAIKHYCKTKLELNNPDYDKKQRMGFWIGNTPKKLYLYEENSGDIILPFGCLRDIYCYGFDKFDNEFKESKSLDFDCKIPLYDYQELATNELFNAKNGILQAPAGCGKTQIGIALMSKIGEKALWITHTKDLLNQSYKRAKQYMDESKLGIISEGKVSIGSHITFATVQTLANIDLEQYKNEWDVIIVDECHRVAGSPTSVSMFYKVLNSLAARHKYGLSATLHRSDGLIQCTFAMLGNIVSTIPEEAVGDRILNVGIKPIYTRTPINLSILGSDGMLNYANLISYLCENKERNKCIINTLIDNKKYSSLILSDRVAHLDNLFNMLPKDMQENAVVINGKMTSKKAKQDRENAITDMQSGIKRYLFATYNLCKEGLDIPRLERLYSTMPQKDYAVVVQSIGRIARVFESKSNPICFDFVDDILYCQKAYKKRWTSYKKINCYEVE